jgi:hypothetical protein
MEAVAIRSSGEAMIRRRAQGSGGSSPLGPSRGRIESFSILSAVVQALMISTCVTGLEMQLGAPPAPPPPLPPIPPLLLDPPVVVEPAPVMAPTLVAVDCVSLGSESPPQAPIARAAQAEVAARKA